MLGFLLPLWTTVALQSTLRVQVVDDAGKPCAHVPLSIRSALVGVTLEPAFAATGEDGVAEFVDFDRFLTEESQKAVPMAVFEFPLAKEEVGPWVSRDSLSKPVRLVLPPHASVSVHVKAADDRASELPLSAKLVWTEGRSCVGWRDAREPGTFLFPCIGLETGSSLLVSNVRGTVLGERSVFVDADSASGLSIDLKLLREVVVIAGRALDSERKPLANRELHWIYATTPDDRWIDAADALSHVTRTDESGRFRLELDLDGTRPRGDGSATSFGALYDDARIQFALRNGSRGETLRGGLVVAAEKKAASIACGDIVLSSPPILAVGSVRSAAEEPLAGVLVDVHVRRPADFGTGDPWPRWSVRRNVLARTGADGSFVLYDDLTGKGLETGEDSMGTRIVRDGASPEDEAFVIVRRAGYVPQLFALSRTASLRIDANMSAAVYVQCGKVFTSSGRFRGVRLVPESNEGELTWEYLCRTVHDEYGRTFDSASPDYSKLRLGWKDVPPGHYRVDVLLSDHEPWVDALASVEIPKGRFGSSFTLPDIDLRGKLK